MTETEPTPDKVMQLMTGSKDGFTYRQADYRSWLTEAGLRSVDIVPTPTPSPLIFAR